MTRDDLPRGAARATCTLRHTAIEEGIATERNPEDRSRGTNRSRGTDGHGRPRGRRSPLRALAGGTVLLLALPGPAATTQLVADFDASPTSGAQALTVSFEDASTGGDVVAWQWDFGDGGTAFVADPSHVYLEPGSYTVSLTVVASPLQIDTVAKRDLVVVEAAELAPDFDVSPSQGVNPLTVTFTDASTGAMPASWSWSFGDGTVGTGAVVDHTYLGPGTYDVTLTTAIGSREASLTKRGVVTVDPAPLVAGFSADVTSGVNPLTVSFTDTSSGGAPTGWSWDFGDGEVSTEQDPVHLYDQPGTFTVTLVVSVGRQQETAVQRDLVTVDPAPLEPAFGARPTSGSLPLEVTFTDETTGTAPTGWLWDFGDGKTSTASDPVHTYLTAGVFDVSLTAFVGEQPATVVQRGLIDVDVPDVTVDFSATPTTGQFPLEVSFVNLTTGDPVQAWLWDFGDGTTSAESDPVHVFTAPGDFDVTLTAFVEEWSTSKQQPGLLSLDGDPVLLTPAILVPAGDTPRSVAVGDVDADGVPDVAVARRGGATVFSGDGTGGLQVAALVETVSSTYDVALGDLDADGRDDLVIGQRWPPAVALAEADGGLGRPAFVAGGQRAFAVDLGDLDGDGALDLVAHAGPSVDTAAGDGGGGFGRPMSSSGIGSSVWPDYGTSSLAVTDMDLDGVLDVVAFGTGVPGAWTGIWTLRGAGDGGLLVPSGPDLGLSKAAAMVTADVDDDGWPDVVAMGTGTDRLHVLFGGPGGLVQGGDWITTLYGDEDKGAVGVGDFNRDGRLDAVAGRVDEDEVAILAGNQEGAFGLATKKAGGGVTSLVVADLDGDGRDDVVSALPDEDALTVHRGADPGRIEVTGSGTSGSSGVPALAGQGALVEGEPLVLTVTGTLEAAPTWLVIGFSELSAPWKGGLLVPSPDVVWGGLLTGEQGLVIETAWPGNVPPATSTWMQVWVQDAGGPEGFSATNGLVLTTVP